MSEKTVSQRAMTRIEEERAALGLYQADLATAIGITQSHYSKLVRGLVPLRVADLETLARRVGLSLCEVIRDPGLEFFAELRPSEVRILNTLRRRPEFMQGLMQLLGIPGEAGPPPRKGRPPRASTDEPKS